MVEGHGHKDHSKIEIEDNILFYQQSIDHSKRMSYFGFSSDDILSTIFKIEIKDTLRLTAYIYLIEPFRIEYRVRILW